MNRLAVVTGGTSGLGFEISKQFLINKVDVIAIYVSNDTKAQKASKQLCKLGDYKTIKLDITNEEETKKFFAGLKRLDYLVNCAGISIEKPFEELSLEEIKKVADVNLYGKMITSKYALPLLKKSKCPRIVSIASRFATNPYFEGMMGLSCSEAGIVMMTKVLALEYAKYNIRVNAVSPSLALTPLAKEIYTQDDINAIASKNPCKRLANPIDIANTVLFLCSEKADYINGENINVNGGLLLI